jgi:hypothetical protein
MNATTKPMPETFAVTADNLELPRGSEFTVEPGPVETGELAMIRIGKLDTISRYYADVAGLDWIVQPGLLTQVVGKTPVNIVGRVALIK